MAEEPFQLMENEEDLKPHSTHATIKWLELNYHLEDGVCLPRSTIYEHYIDFCQRERSQPVNAASFGKIIRQQFPSLTTRRLGTRGQSKYHYFGLGIRPSSRYYTKDYSEKLGQGVSKKIPDSKKVPAHEKPSAVLPSFPNVHTLNLADNIPVDKLKTFVVMYRAHCQRIVDSVVRANFNEVENFLLHFWKGMPTHMLPVLASDVVVDLVAHCDSLLYRVINNVLISSPLQSVPDSLVADIRSFSEMLRQWLEQALEGLPESLQEAKYKVAEGFSNSIKRQTALTQLAEVTRNTLQANNMLEQLKEDWSTIDLLSIYTQILYVLQPLGVPQHYQQIIPSLLEEFGVLLECDADLERIFSWVEDILHRTVRKSHEEEHYTLKQASQVFLLTWKSFTSKIIRELTLESAPSFGCFHLLHMLVDDYIVHLLEAQLEGLEERAYSSRLEERRKDKSELPDSDDGEQLPSYTHSSPSQPPHSSADQPHTPSSSSSTSSPSIHHPAPSEHQPVSATDMLSFTDPFPLPSLRSVSSSSSLLPSSTTSTITFPSVPQTCSPGMLHSKPTSAVPHQRTKPQLSSSHPHLPFATMGPQPPFTSPPPHPLPPTLQQQRYGQQYPTAPSSQGNATAPLSASAVTGDYEMMAHPLPSTSYSGGHSTISLTAQPSTLSHPFPLSSTTTLTLPTDPSAAGNVVGRPGILPHVAAVPNFPTFSVPLAHAAPTSSSSSPSLPTASNLSLFPPMPGVYPYTPFMSLSTVPQLSGQMNPPFGASIPGQPNPVAGYPYLPPSLYTSTASAPVCTELSLGERSKLK